MVYIGKAPFSALTCTATYILNLAMLKKSRCNAHFYLSANQIAWSRLLIQILILNDKQCRSRSVAFPGTSRTRVKAKSSAQFYKLKKNGYAFRGGNSVKMFYCLPSQKWSKLKGKYLLPCKYLDSILNGLIQILTLVLLNLYALPLQTV